MYNLAHLYIYDQSTENNIIESIKLLIRSSNLLFIPSQDLLCLASINEFGFDLKNIKKGIDKYNNEKNDLSDRICQLILNKNLLNYEIFEEQLNLLINIDFIYNDFFIPVSENAFNYQVHKNLVFKNYKIPGISSDFYEGFGIDILVKKD